MSISTADTEAEQNGRPRICSPTGRRVIDTRLPPNTEGDHPKHVLAVVIRVLAVTTQPRW